MTFGKTHIHTYKVERLVVASILAGALAVSHARAIEWLGALAVLAGFAHGQVTSRLAEKEASKAPSDVQVECYKWAPRYFVGKEILWFAYFVAVGAYSALVGCFVFAAYPVWRRLYLARKLARQGAP